MLARSLESYCRNIKPYPRLYIFLGVWVLCAIHHLTCFVTIPAEITPGCLAPDMSSSGYTSQQALDWYEAIGREGRLSYACILFPLDLLIMVGYVSCLTSQILVTFPERTLRFLVYVPIVTVLLDLVETITHASMTMFLYECVLLLHGNPIEPSFSSSLAAQLLSIASTATRCKFLFLNASVLLGLIGMICQRWWPSTVHDDGNTIKNHTSISKHGTAIKAKTN